MATDQHRHDDATLVRAAQAGDHEAFGELFRRHHAGVRRACVARMANAVEGDEIAQAAFVRAFERIDQCRDDRRFGAWVQVIAVHLCTDTWRSRSRTLPVDQPFEHLAAPDDCEENLLRSERLDGVNRALSSLPSRQRRVLVARDLEGRRPGEIAASLAISLGAVDSLLLRARRRMAVAYRGVLSEQGTVSTSVTTVTAGATSAAVNGGPITRALGAASRAFDMAAWQVASTLGMGPAGTASVAQRAVGVAVAVALSVAPVLPVAVPATDDRLRRPVVGLIDPVVAGLSVGPTLPVLPPTPPPPELGAVAATPADVRVPSADATLPALPPATPPADAQVADLAAVAPAVAGAQAALQGVAGAAAAVSQVAGGLLHDLAPGPSEPGQPEAGGLLLLP